jgi:IS30 family transposase
MKKVDWKLVEKLKSEGRSQSDIAKLMKIHPKSISRHFKSNARVENTCFAKNFYREDRECDWYFQMFPDSKIRVDKDGFAVCAK